MLVYLGGPIDLAGDKDYRKRLTEALNEVDISAFDPKDAFKLADLEDEEDMKSLVAINKHAMETCSASVFILDSKVPSIGTPIEMYMATQAELPFVVVWLAPDNKPIPAYISALAKQCNILHAEELSDPVINEIIYKIC